MFTVGLPYRRSRCYRLRAKRLQHSPRKVHRSSSKNHFKRTLPHLLQHLILGRCQGMVLRMKKILRLQVALAQMASVKLVRLNYVRKSWFRIIVSTVNEAGWGGKMRTFSGAQCVFIFIFQSSFWYLASVLMMF